LAPVDFGVHTGSLDGDECNGLFCFDKLVDALAGIKIQTQLKDTLDGYKNVNSLPLSLFFPSNSPPTSSSEWASMIAVDFACCASSGVNPRKSCSNKSFYFSQGYFSIELFYLIIRAAY